MFQICIPMSPEDSAGRSSWDETAVLVAVKGYKPWYATEKGKMVVAVNGSNIWSKESSRHNYLIEEQSPAVVQQLINTLIMHQPIKN